MNTQPAHTAARAHASAAHPAPAISPPPDFPMGVEYMGRMQLEWFERQLRAKRARALAMLSEMQAGMPQAEQFADPSDKASNFESSELVAAQGDLVRAELRAVDAAIGRIAAGDYGYCEETGEEIGLPRLIANPTATRTVEAQSAIESQLRMRGLV